MQKTFEYFVIYAEMRTGSNFLEENINSYTGLNCWGEAFNPTFICHSKKKELFGFDLDAREKNPVKFLKKLQDETDGLAGFRFFHDHDQRIFEETMQDPKCAKIILTRNPLESYVSRKIAAKTGQWRLKDLKDSKTSQIEFDRAEFLQTLEKIRDFQFKILRGLQTSGQTGYYINYEDLNNIDVINGLTKFLGVTEKIKATVQKTKVQNPSRLEEKIINFDKMKDELGSIDHFNLSNTPNFEPRRGPIVPSYHTSSAHKLVYMPIKGSPEKTTLDWLNAIDPSSVETGLNQQEIKQWKRQHKNHRSFTVISHPVQRLHRSFCHYIVNINADTYTGIRETLRGPYKVGVPKEGNFKNYSLEDHRAAFINFANFIKGNLNNQTSIRCDGAWASQSEIIKGFTEITLPDVILREETLQKDLSDLIPQETTSITQDPDTPYTLNDIYNDDVEKAVRRAYQRDYMMFGYAPWSTYYSQ